MQSYDYIGHFIRAYRAAHGMSLDELAHKSGVSRSMIANIESAQKIPTIAVLDKIAQAMSVELVDLVRPKTQNEEVKIYEPTLDNRVKSKDSPAVFHRLLSPSGGSKVEFYCFHFTDFGKTQYFTNPHGAVKYLWVEHGSLEVYMSCEALVLTAGQMIKFSAASPHRFGCNNEGELARGVFFIMEHGV